MTLQEASQELRNRWERDGDEPLPGLEPAELDSWERQHSVLFPEDLRIYFSIANGLPNHRCDSQWMEFIPLQELQTLAEEREDYNPVPDTTALKRQLGPLHRTFVLVDYLASSHLYTISLSENDRAPRPIYLVVGDLARVAAESWHEFLVKYLEDFDSLFV